MKQLLDFGDIRNKVYCVHCGGNAETKDHVPSRVFLEKPYPRYLPTVPACVACNNGSSIDEAYVAALIECAKCGATEIRELKSERIRRLLKANPELRERLTRSMRETRDGVVIEAESERVGRVALKMARGHTAYELGEPRVDAPSFLGCVPLHSMQANHRNHFETPLPSQVVPEVGSRGMQRMFVGGEVRPTWNVVQTGRYRFLALVGNGILIRVVLGEYLACEVMWD